MTQESYPHSSPGNTITTEDQWIYWASRLTLDGVAGVPTDSALETFADATGMQVKVKAGQAQVRGIHYRSTAQETLAIVSNASGNPRIDRVVLRLNMTAKTIRLAVVQGTPGATPVVSALTQTDGGTWEESLAQVRVENAAATIFASKVTDERRWLPVRTRPFLSTKRPSSLGELLGLETDTKLLMVPDGTGGWKQEGPTFVSPKFTIAGKQIAFGSLVATTNSFGDINLGFSVSQAHGWSAVDIVVGWNGDSTARPNMVIGKQTEPGNYDTGWNVRCWRGNDGTVFANVPVRVDYIAVGS